MPGHVCDSCGRIFQQKSHLDDHISKKSDCAETVSLISTDLSDHIEDEIDMQREILSLEYTQATKRLQRTGRRISYENQQEAAVECVQYFRNGKSVVVLVAQPGAGKTGAAQEVMFKMCTGRPEDNFNDIIPIKKTVICSGMSDIEWRDQFAKSMLPSLGKYVYHRGNLRRNKAHMAKAKLLIDDECHIAAGKDMVVSHEFREAGWTDIALIEEHGRKNLQISATPEAVAHDLKQWGSRAACVVLKPGPDYKGFQVMLDENRIRKTPNLTSYDQVLTLLQMWDARYTTTTKKYFPMRIRETVVKWIEEASKELGWAAPLRHDSACRIEDIDKQMRTAPSANQIILVKGFWRASKRLVRDHVGGSLETPAQKRNTTTTAQGLTARFCDTYTYSGDYLNPDLRPLHFCDVEAIKEYLNWFKHDLDFTKAAYSGSRITADGKGNVSAPPTKLHSSNTIGIEEIKEEKIVEEETYALRTYKTQEEAIQVCKSLGKMPRRRTPEHSGDYIGYYLSSVGNSKSARLTYDFVCRRIHKSYGGKGKTGQRILSPCYLDIDNKDTLRFVVVIDKDNLHRLAEIDCAFPPIGADVIEHV